VSEQTRGKDACVIGYQNVSGTEQCGQVADRAIVELAGSAVEHEQARVAARNGILRNQLIRQMKIERSDFHALPRNNLHRISVIGHRISVGADGDLGSEVAARLRL
jgi:hypothetical protein